MSTEPNIQERLNTYSQKTNANAVQIALLDQRQTVTEKRVEEYHKRLHEVEDAVLVLRTIQEIHATKIASVHKIVIGNGERETIPADIERLENSIKNILHVDWSAMSIRIQNLEKFQDTLSSRMWQVWMAILLLLVTNILTLILK
jgi:hypothetical protein